MPQHPHLVVTKVSGLVSAKYLVVTKVSGLVSAKNLMEEEGANTADIRGGLARKRSRSEGEPSEKAQQT